MVDLPAPLSPIRPTTSPGSKEKLTSLSGLMAPKFFDTLRTSSKVKRVLPGRRALLGLLADYPSGILHGFAALVERLCGAAAIFVIPMMALTFSHHSAARVEGAAAGR